MEIEYYKNTEYQKILKAFQNISLHLKTYSKPKSKFRKTLVENTSVIAQEIDKLRLQIPEAYI